MLAAASPGPLDGTLVRVVESQEQVATTVLVDGDLTRQDALERLIESSKPARRPGTEHLDYLLATPWRYPPLRYGSRFGTRDEPSLFYGSLAVEVALAETAFYRSVLLEDTDDPPERLISHHTSFEARYRSDRGLALQHEPFAEHRAALTDPARYSACQALGTAVRELGIEAFEFVSARDPRDGLNVALVEPVALVSSRHHSPREWLCTTTTREIVFRSREQPPMLLGFARETFEIDGRLPRPA